jgi:predicted transcriptional regulator
VTQEQFKVLKTMSEATTRMDLTMFAQKVGLTPSQALQQVQELAKKGFLQRVGGGYGVTEKGKAALKAFIQVPEGTGFHFYLGIDRPTELTAQSLLEFYKCIKQVSVDSLEFHVYRGDFENWVSEACKEGQLAEQIGCIETVGFKGEDLRRELLKLLETKYGIQELM